MKLAFIVRAGPYAFQHMQTVVDLTRAALDCDHDVGIFLAEDAVVAMNDDCRTGDQPNMTKALSELAERGVQVQGCGACCLFRGQSRSDIADNLQMAGIASLARMVDEADRVLSFGY